MNKFDNLIAQILNNKQTLRVAITTNTNEMSKRKVNATVSYIVERVAHHQQRIKDSHARLYAEGIQSYIQLRSAFNAFDWPFSSDGLSVKAYEFVFLYMMEYIDPRMLEEIKNVVHFFPLFQKIEPSLAQSVLNRLKSIEPNLISSGIENPYLVLLFPESHASYFSNFLEFLETMLVLVTKQNLPFLIFSYAPNIPDISQFPYFSVYNNFDIPQQFVSLI